MGQAYIYVLHFEHKHHHAQHYVGCTEKLLQRLTAHAIGHGSALCRHLHTIGVNWQLATLYTTTHAQMRRMERSLKNQHHAHRYCTICTSENNALPGCREYPICTIPFKTDSEQLRGSTLKLRTAPIYRFIKPEEHQETLQQIKKLMSAEKDALGFIPVGGTAGLEDLLPNRQIALAENSGELLAYAAFTIPMDKTTVNIQQAVVTDGARLQGIGKNLVDMIQDRYPDQALSAKVREDLAANEFWLALGFLEFGVYKHKTSMRPINHYVRPNGVV
jgi:GNAT superfamily N-acetyltransferase/predicted GIY-YIG superfamily endonuclease